MFEDEDISVPVKFMETRYFVRMDDGGLPQMVRLQPIFTDDGFLVVDSVYLFFDDNGPTVIDRGSAEQLVAALVPIGEVTQYKHRSVN